MITIISGLIAFAVIVLIVEIFGEPEDE